MENKSSVIIIIIINVPIITVIIYYTNVVQENFLNDDIILSKFQHPNKTEQTF